MLRTPLGAWNATAMWLRHVHRARPFTVIAQDPHTPTRDTKRQASAGSRWRWTQVTTSSTVWFSPNGTSLGGESAGLAATPDSYVERRRRCHSIHASGRDRRANVHRWVYSGTPHAVPAPGSSLQHRRHEAFREPPFLGNGIIGVDAVVPAETGIHWCECAWARTHGQPATSTARDGATITRRVSCARRSDASTSAGSSPSANTKPM